MLLEPRLLKLAISFMKSIETNEAGHIPMTVLRFNTTNTASHSFSETTFT
jgi:hypothetical protein